MATLKEISQDMEDVLSRLSEAVDEETGEVTDAGLLEAFENLNMAWNEKVENCIRWVISSRAEMKSIKEEKARLDKRLKHLGHEVDWMVSQYLPSTLKPGETYHCADGDIRYRHSKAVRITDVDALPSEYVRMIREVNRAEMLKALKEGRDVPGAELEERVRMIVV